MFTPKIREDEPIFDYIIFFQFGLKPPTRNSHLTTSCRTPFFFSKFNVVGKFQPWNFPRSSVFAGPTGGLQGGGVRWHWAPMAPWVNDGLISLWSLVLKSQLFFFFLGGGRQKMSRGTICCWGSVYFFCKEKRQVLNESNLAMQSPVSAHPSPSIHRSRSLVRKLWPKIPQQKAKHQLLEERPIGEVWRVKMDMGHGKKSWVVHKISIFHLPFCRLNFQPFPVPFSNLQVGIQPFFENGTIFAVIMKCGSGAAAMRNKHVEVTLSR